MKTTRQAEILKIFPEVLKTDGIINICPKIFAEQNCECFATCVRCRYDFWLSEIEVPDGKSEELAHGVEQKAKADNGKLKLSLVPVQIIKDIAKVREYGCKKSCRGPWHTLRGCRCGP